jgi:hypothetical protein
MNDICNVAHECSSSGTNAFNKCHVFLFSQCYAYCRWINISLPSSYAKSTCDGFILSDKLWLCLKYGLKYFGSGVHNSPLNITIRTTTILHYTDTVVLFLTICSCLAAGTRIESSAVELYSTRLLQYDWDIHYFYAKQMILPLRHCGESHSIRLVCQQPHSYNSWYCLKSVLAQYL